MRHFGVQMASTSTYISNRKKCVHAKLCVHFPGCSSVTFLMRRNTNQWPCWERKCFFNSYIWFSQDFEVYSFFTSFEEPFCVLKIKAEGRDTLLDRAFEPLPMKLLQCSACGVGPDLYQCIWLRALTGNQPNTGIVIIVGENWSTGKKPAQTLGFGRDNMQTCTEKFPPGVVIAWRQRR